jgi:hypothetical protein
MTSNPDQESNSDANAESPDSPQDQNTKGLLKAYLVRLKLKLIANYILDAIAPILAIIALLVAINATRSTQASQIQLAKTVARLDNVSAALLASQNALETLKAALAQEKAAHNEDRNKLDEKTKQTIQSITQVQKKLKISPTLDEQLQAAASPSAATPQVNNSTSSAPALLAPVTVYRPGTVAKPASTLPRGSATISTGAEKNPKAQVQALKDAIDQFNKK